MIKIGFIDYYLSEWHANNYPAMIRSHPLAKEKGIDVCFAYAKEYISPNDGVSTDEWCEKFGVKRMDSIEELVDASDCIVVLSPDNQKYHEELSRYALTTGKPVYIDKTFAPSADAAERIFDLAKKHNTPVYSSSSYRFSDELAEFRNRSSRALSCAVSGNGEYETYAVHLFEILTTVMNGGAKRIQAVMYGGNRALVVEYFDGRQGLVLQEEASRVPFAFSVEKNDNSTVYKAIGKGFIENFVSELVGFFADKIPRVESNETLEIMRLIDAGKAAFKKPFTWINI